MDNNQTFQIGDTIYITDKQSNMYGKKGVLLVKTSDHYIVTINDNNQRYKTIVPIGYVSHEEPTITDDNMAYGGGIYGLEIGDSVTFEGQQYKIGSFDVVSPKTTLVYLNDLNNNPANDYRGDYLKVNISNINKKYADGGGVDNDVWEKYQIQDKHGYVSYFDDKENALKFLKENEDSFAIRWDDAEQPIMAKRGYLIDIINTDGVPNILANGGGVEDEKNKEVSFLTVPSARKIVAYWEKYGKMYLNGRVLIKQTNKNEIEISLYEKTLYPENKNLYIDYNYNMDEAKERILDEIRRDKVLRKETKYAEGGGIGKTVYSLDQIEYDIEYKNNEGDTYSETFNSKDEALKEIFRLEKLGYIVTSRQRSFKDDGTFNGYFAKGGTTKQQKKVAKVMHEFKEGELHSGKSGKVVTDPKQAIAIALSESQKMEQGGNLPYTYSLIRRWSDNMVTDADIDSVIEAMIKAKITDADLVTPPTKTGTQFTKAKEKLNNEIFKKIQGVYVGNLKGNQPYGIIATMVDRATRFDDKTIAEYKKQKTATKSGWKHKKTAKA
jgi:hypothetical protein